MTSFFSPMFLVVFLPATIVAYALTRERWRWVTLLVASYLFFFILSRRLVVFVMASTVSVYLLALWLDRLATAREAALVGADRERRKDVRRRCATRMRAVVALGVVFNLGLLVACKYLAFFGGGIEFLLGLVGIEASVPVLRLALPTGISFYTLMAISYLVDVYHGTVAAERNLAHVALFLCFFPQMVEGPFCRFNQTLPQLLEGRPIRGNALLGASLRILYGLVKKIVVADRLDILVRTVFMGYEHFDGTVIALAAVTYTIELYCDFSGAMDVVCGVGQAFGITMPENFRQPFFSRTASEFWQRWHVTLGAWFRDYIYYPVSLSGPMKRLTKGARRRLGRQYGPIAASAVALLCVWVANGLWHGSGSQYLFFGLYYFVVIVAGNLIEPIARQVTERVGVSRESLPYRGLQVARTLVVVFVGELFFRADGLMAGLDMFSRMMLSPKLASLVDGTMLSLGMDVHDYAVVGLVLLGVLAVDVARERGRDLRALPVSRPTVGLACCVALFMFVVVFGAYGAGYTPVPPMYAKF